MKNNEMNAYCDILWDKQRDIQTIKSYKDIISGLVSNIEDLEESAANNDEEENTE